MNITPLSKKKLETACLMLKSKREKAVKSVTLGTAGAQSVMCGFRNLAKALETSTLRLDADDGKPILLDVDYVMGGEGCDIWAVMMIGVNDEAPLIKTWFDQSGHAHIQCNYGNYSTMIKYATAEDVSDWIVDYLRLQV
ncbi:hypothetical protein OBP_019 [Pseudomonas phage OBP]|uniref:hypothetical protein n=1 Tax=Pseudomonas phage OBP TaxID=1124849 RepID=UPI000240D610|nr:hypothetical protein OBP_019 [Pseudomonas phage OBP]AEV89456.1 hypothetical protein OBP_019 [Pseudomonas phage OBP]